MLSPLARPEATAIRERLLEQIATVGAIDLLCALVREQCASDIRIRERSEVLERRRQELHDDGKFLDELYLMDEVLHEFYKSDALRRHIHSRLPELSEEVFYENVSYCGSLLTHTINSIEDVDLDVLLQETEALKVVSDVTVRAQRAYWIEQRVRDVISSRELYEDNSGKCDFERRLRSDNLSIVPHLLGIVERRVRRGKVVEKRHFCLPDILRPVFGAQREKSMRETIGTVDWEKLRENTKKFGAKGANLLALRDVLPRINQCLQGNVTVHIPRFTLVPTRLYDCWRVGGDITKDLHQFHQWEGGKSLLIRSSAVCSEDGETLTGAGVYHSEHLKKGASFEEFSKAVELVYQSVDSEKARLYRNANNVFEEHMGLVIHECASRPGREKGYINTVRPYAPKLSEIIFEDEGLRVVCWKKYLEQGLFEDGSSREAIKDSMYYNVDGFLHVRSFGSWSNLQDLGMLLEMHYGVPVQVEFLDDHKHINLLQARVLPRKLRSTFPVEFPGDLEVLHEGDALGIGDMALPVLPTNGDNTEKRGAVIFFASFLTSKLPLERYLPKEGAVIVLCPAQDFFGHIETRCVERGLLLVFASPRSERPLTETTSAMLERSESTARLTVYRDFAGHSQIRVVSDGMRGRVYAAD